MRAIAFLLILLSLSWAVSFGRSVLEIERVWEITSDGPYNFTGALVANDSNQEVISVSTEPEAVIMVEDETIHVHHEGNGSGIVRASAVVQVAYQTDILADSPMPSAGLQPEGLTAANGEIEAKARELAHGDSVLLTIRDLVNWVHSNIEYDIGYSGKTSSAAEIFRDRKGVCVEYSHLLISMFRSLGLESRYVSGYVLADSWQPHAWVEVEVPGYGWLAVDPTLGQAGVLDNTHLAVQKRQDHTQAYDVLVSDYDGAALSATDSIMARFLSEDPEGISLSMEMDLDTLVVEAQVENARDEYVFGVYSFVAPENYDGETSSVLLLRPLERVRRYHGLNQSFFREDFIYEVPVAISFNDVTESKVYSIDKRERAVPEPLPDSYYSIPVIIAALVALVVLTSRR